MPEAQAGPEQARLHGVLVDVYGIGVLLQGPSGSGKSECALDLVVRGHRLVADDLILVSRESLRIVIGQGPEEIRHHMEVRGLGVINIRDLFGIAAIRYRKRIELVVMLEPWSPEVEYDRLGVDDQTTELLGVPLPLLRIPVSAGRNMAILVEVAARNHLLKLMGHHAARQFADRLDRGLQRPPPLPATSEEDTE
ncbi:MAG TPA: HPr(Ser) kinase/phosphatase [Candidatus Methylomirabilis sp.]|nr:HPr(Ser) kinase/phosphatase [Candidatus Methylomirabilis sp.]